MWSNEVFCYGTKVDFSGIWTLLKCCFFWQHCSTNLNTCTATNSGNTHSVLLCLEVFCCCVLLLLLFFCNLLVRYYISSNRGHSEWVNPDYSVSVFFHFFQNHQHKRLIIGSFFFDKNNFTKSFQDLFFLTVTSRKKLKKYFYQSIFFFTQEATLVL